MSPGQSGIKTKSMFPLAGHKDQHLQRFLKISFSGAEEKIKCLVEMFFDFLQ